MGLDMYLSKIDKEGNSIDFGYWRKANAVHSYFVKNVQGGQDDQKEYEVSKDVFEDLKGRVTRILSQAKGEGMKLTENGHVDFERGFKPSEKLAALCDELLPTQSGFFFGSTEYDEWYFDTLLYTYALLNNVLDDWDKDGHKAYYYSCWW